MNLRSRNKVDASFSMSSMTDLVFLLLIFFIIVSTLVSPYALPVDLPVSANKSKEKQNISLRIDKDLIYSVNNKIIDPTALEATLANTLNTEAEPSIVFHVDQLVPTGETVKVLDIATTKLEGVTLIKKLKPNLIFLDIVLDEGTGFDVLEDVKNFNTNVIFVTAFSEYALKAFNYSVVDYILKPIEIEALILAVHKVQKNVLKNNYFSKNQLKINEENQQGFFASNRIDGKGDDDIYSFKNLDIEEIGILKTLKNLQRCTIMVWKARAWSSTIEMVDGMDLLMFYLIIISRLS